MQSFVPTLNPQTLKSWRIITPILALLLVLAVACGEAAAPTSPPPAAQATEAPQAATQPTEAPEAVAQPTSVPAPTSAPAVADLKVHPGKLTIMLAELGNERFDYNFASTSSGGRSYARMLYGHLVQQNERKEMVPGIATHWGLSADGLTWTFKIREGVKFHDGSEVTPEDVLWTLQHGFSPGSAEYTQQTTAASLSRVMNTIELRGTDEITVNTQVPFTGFPLLVSKAGVWSFGIMPKRTELHNEAEELAYDNDPIAAGPMRLDQHIKAVVLKFERFDDYYYQPDNGFPEDKRVNFQSLDLVIAPEDSTRVAAIRAGEADLAPTSLASRGQVEKGGGRVIFAQETSALEPRLVGCWKQEFPCSDKRVRQAMAYAIDKELIRDTLLGPEAFQVKGWAGVTPSSTGYVPELDPFPFDPDKARQLLADAGYPEGNGFGKVIVNTWVASTPFLIESAQLAADMWERELGLDVEVRVGDEGGVKKAQYGRQLDGQILWRDNETKIDITTTLISQFGDLESRNRFHEDPELLSAVNEAVQILDPEERVKGLTKLLLRLKDESYWFGVGYFNTPWAVGPRVLTWQPYPLTDYPSGLNTITLK